MPEDPAREDAAGTDATGEDMTGPDAMREDVTGVDVKREDVPGGDVTGLGSIGYTVGTGGEVTGHVVGAVARTGSKSRPHDRQ
jgi:hypothetical protein